MISNMWSIQRILKSSNTSRVNGSRNGQTLFSRRKQSGRNSKTAPALSMKCRKVSSAQRATSKSLNSHLTARPPNKLPAMDKFIPTVETQMLIRKPVAQVFQAFVDPAITTHFWFTKSSGNLAVGKTVTWEWEMYGVSMNVLVKELIENKRIVMEWGDPVT